jgi:hypothetical protein
MPEHVPLGASLVAIGLFAAIFVAIWKWEKSVLRFLPFVFSTALPFFVYWERPASVLDYLATIAIVNGMSGILLFIGWLETRRGRK